MAEEKCFKFTMSKLVGYLIVLGAVIVKVPQILKIVSNNSTAGISALACYLETTVYMQSAAYNMHLGMQFSVYGENLFLTAQNLAIVALIWYYDKTCTTYEQLGFSLFVAVYSSILFSESTPESMWYYVSSSTLFLSLLSKVPQIWTNFQNKSTGHLAFFTFFLMFLGTIARAATVFFESSDPMLRAQQGLALALNGILVVQFALYWNNKPKSAETKKVEQIASVYDKVNKGAKQDTKKNQ